MSTYLWRDVDHSGASSEHIDYLDRLNTQAAVRASKQKSYAWMGARGGAQLLDVGCGAGDDVRALAQIAGPTGRVVGVDASERMIAEARARGTGGMPVEFAVGDASRLDFGDGEFDAARTDRTLQHVAEPSLALSEMARVVKPGGRIVALEPDWGSLLCDSDDVATTRHVLNAICDAHPHGWIGRRLPGMFKALGLAEIMVSVEIYPVTDFEVGDYLARLRDAVRNATIAGTISADDGARWITDQQRRSAAGRMFGSISAILVAGTSAN